MKDIGYAAPTRLDDAVQLLAEHGSQARVLAGGTDILVQLREGLRDADFVVDVKKIDELTDVAFSPESGLQLGAAAPCWTIYESPEIAAAYPALADATKIVGGWQIQSRASVGGNLCNSSPAADTIPPLIAHAAVCHIAGTERRTVPVADFCTGPGRNVLGDGELLAALTLPPPEPHSSSAYERFIPRNEMDIAVVGAASWVRLNETGDKIEAARIALAAVAPTPVLAAEAAASLAGQPCTDEVFAHAGDLARRVAAPIDDMRGDAEYRTHLVGVLTKRTLATAVARARN